VNPSDVWIVTLGYNHIDDTLECLQSLSASEGGPYALLFVDNASTDGSPEKVRAAFPIAHVLENGANLGFARGFNEGLKYAAAHGAQYVFMINNDTIVDPACVKNLLADAEANPDAGIWVPKILYYADRDVIWSAGSRFRAFPPAIVMRGTRHPDDGSFDAPRDIRYATSCALLFSRRFLGEVGMLDGDYFILCDDYDLCIRALEAKVPIRFVPEAKMWHKVSKSTGVGTPNPFFWKQYGRSTAILFRKHANHPWVTGPVAFLYILARMVVEGHRYGFRPFLEGWREGRRATLTPPERI
jgi:hypothetical protein